MIEFKDGREVSARVSTALVLLSLALALVL